MGQFSMEIRTLTGSVLGGNQQTMVYNRDSPDGIVVTGGKYWELPALNELIGF